MINCVIMTKLIHLFVICVMLLLPNATGLYSQSSWTLESCVQRAMEQSLSVQSSTLAEQNSMLSIEQARLARYPSLNGNFNVAANFGRTIDPTTNDFINKGFYSNNLGLSSGVILYNARRLQNNIKQAEKSLMAAKANTESVKYDIALRVANQYLAILFAEENLNIASEQLRLIQSQKDNLDRLISAGVRAKNDRFELDAQLAQRSQTVLENTNSLQLAKLGLAQLLRLKELTIEVSAEEELGAILDPDNLTLEALIEGTFANHPALKSAQLNIEVAEIGEDIARSALYPTVSLGGNLGTAYSNSAVTVSGFETQFIDQTVVINNLPTTIQFAQEVPIFEDSPYFNQLNDNLSLGLGLGVSVPIWNNGNGRIGIERAKLNTLNQDIAYQQTVESITLDLQNVLFDARNAKQSYLASQTSLKAQQAAFDNSDKRYQAGALGNLEWITAQNLLQQAEVNTIIAKYNHYFAVTVLEYYLNGVN